MEQTIKNMELILNKVEVEYREQNTPEMKTLMNTYRNLLQRFLRKPLGHSSAIDNKGSLLDQQAKLNKLFDKVEKAVTQSLLDREYKNADNLTMVLERVEKSSDDINQLFRPKQTFSFTTTHVDGEEVTLKGRPIE